MAGEPTTHQATDPAQAVPSTTEEDLALGLHSVLEDGEDQVEAARKDLGDEDLLRLHRWMVVSRVLDDRMLALQRSGRIGFYGEVRGQEASVVGCGDPLADQDWVFPALREGLIMLMRGYPLERFIASNYGNSLDNMKGRQMPCHYSAREVKQVSWSSCMATQLLHATGAAYAAKIKKTDEAFIGFVGDGGTSENDFHAAMNFAGVHKTPNVFVVQNNQWAISVPGTLQTASKTYAVKARAYGFQGIRVDGNDVLAVRQVMQLALEKARRGDGPTLIETVTFRMGGHSTSDDPTRYREKSLEKQWQQRDPISRFEAYLEKQGLMDEARAKTVRQEAADWINQAVKIVEETGNPAPDTLFEDVYRQPPEHLLEQREEMRRLLDEYGAPVGH
jgi:pyruvate dehydrogenase E1 component alpha subunit